MLGYTVQPLRFLAADCSSNVELPPADVVFSKDLIAQGSTRLETVPGWARGAQVRMLQNLKAAPWYPADLKRSCAMSQQTGDTEPHVRGGRSAGIEMLPKIIQARQRKIESCLEDCSGMPSRCAGTS